MKIVIILTAAFLLSTNSVHADMVENVVLNGKNVDFVNYGETYEDVKLPARSFFETAGFTVQWYDDNQRVTAFSDDFNITMFANDDNVYINKVLYPIFDRFSVDDGVFVVPLQAASQLLDATVVYDDNVIYINSPMVIDSSGWEYDVFSEINKKREQYGLDPLIWNGDLANVAKQHCDDMISRDYFSHNSPEGITPFDRLKMNGIKYSSAAENLAAGQPTPDAVVKAWMKSKSHRDNILNPSLRECGVAFSRGGEYGIYWAQEFATTK